ncbi:MAG: GumC family protein [Devosia sp.]
MNNLSNIDFRFYFWLFVRRLPLFLLTASLVAAAGITLTLLWPPSYQATAKILVESPQIPTDLAKSTVPTGSAEQFQIIQEDVLSRENVLALADRLSIYASRKNMSEFDKFDDMMRRIEVLPTPVSAAGGGVATVYRISFKADRPDLAADVVNQLVTMILDKDVQIRTQRANDTVAFFSRETERLDTELQKLDSGILNFKNEHINALPDSVDFRRNQQVAQQQRLLLLQQDEVTLRKRQADLISRPLETSATALTPEEQSLQALQQALIEQRALFSDDSPTVSALRARIAALQSDIVNRSGQAAAPRSARDIELADIADRLASITAERASIEKSIKALDTSIAETPGNETRLNSLQRDHQNMQAQYDAAVGRLAEASTGQQIELLLKGEKLSLIENAVPPQTPLGPKQKVLLLASLAMAMLTGLLAVIAPELVNRRIRRPDDLIGRLQIVPFVTVPYIERTMFGPARRAIRLGMLIIIPALLLALGTIVAPINIELGSASTHLTAAISKP